MAEEKLTANKIDGLSLTSRVCVCLWESVEGSGCCYEQIFDEQ